MPLLVPLSLMTLSSTPETRTTGGEAQIQYIRPCTVFREDLGKMQDGEFLRPLQLQSVPRSRFKYADFLRANKEKQVA